MVANPNANPNPIFYLPDLGEGLEEAELIEWCVAVGQSVEENEILAKMETAKALVDVPSPRAGVIAQLHGKPGQMIKVGTPLVTYKAGAPSKAKAAAKGDGRRADAGTVVGNLGDATEEEEGKVRAAPAVRRLARELGVEIEQVSGTGIAGRVTAEDVRGAAGVAAETDRGTVVQEESAPAAETPKPAPAPAPAAAEGETLRTPFRGVRRTIAEHLRHSVSHAIHYTVMDEVDITALDALRRKLIAASNEKITVLPFVASAVCRVLTGRHGTPFTKLNSTVDDDKQEIIQHRAVHLGIATDTETGLMVPVIRDADRLGVLELSRQIAQLAHACRDRSIKADQLHGSTFTISNFGSLAGRFGTPIINYPESGVLGIGRAREGVIVRDGMLGVGKLLPLSLSADHRVIDGATAAGFLGKIMQLLQSPEELLSPGR